MKMNDTGIRLQKFFSDCGILSRRAAEAEILAGKITVNGMTAELGMRIDPQTDEVCYNGKRIEPQNGSRSRTYIMLHKPIRYVTTMSDEKGRKTVADLISAAGKRVYPIGRLDMYSEGLLLCTDDGDLANRMMHPSHNVAKKYVLTVAGVPADDVLSAFTSPMTLDGYQLRPVEIQVLRLGIARPDGQITSELEVTLHEGRNRQIRRMCEKVGLKVLRLQRISVGDLQLGSLPAGKWRYLSEEEIQYLKSI